MTDLSLTRVLELLGYWYRKASSRSLYACDVVRVRDGAVVFTGRASEVWDWLRTTGQI